jgi:predicted transcriptional regulator
MRDIWARPEHRAKIDEVIAKRLADPNALAAMRARIAAVSARRTTESRRTDMMRAWFERHASGKFASMEEMHDWIVEQYQSGESARRIGLALDMAHNAVVERLRLRGVVPAKRGAGRRNRSTSATYLARKGINDLAEFDRQVAALYAEGNSANALRLAYGVSPDAIRTSLHRSGIPLRGPGNHSSKYTGSGTRPVPSD